MVFLFEKEKRFSADLITGLGLPLAVFGEDWRVLHWNREMADMTGLDAESAKKRPGKVIELVFGAIGGISEARKFSRNYYATPVTWSVRNTEGGETNCSWRLFMTEMTERDAIEKVTILAGIRLPGVSRSEQVDHAIDSTGFLAGSLSRLVSARGPRQYASALADFASGATGAGGVTVTLSGRERQIEARSGKDPATRTVSAPVFHPDGFTDEPVRIELTPDASPEALEHVGLIASNTLGSAVAGALGRDLLDMGGRGSHRTLILTDASGWVTCPGMVDGIWVEADSHISRYLSLPVEDLAEALRISRLAGRSGCVVDRMDPGRRYFVFSLCTHTPGKAMWMADQGWFGCGNDPPSWLQAVRSLSTWLPGKAQASKANLTAISRVLSRDDPVHPALMSLSLEMASISRVSSYLGLVGRALLSNQRDVSSADVLNLVVQNSIRKGRRPPDLDLRSDPPFIKADPVLLADLLDACVIIAGYGLAPSISISSAPVEGSGSVPFNRRVAESAVFIIRWDRAIEPRIGLEKALALATEGMMPVGVELELLAIALGLTGCIFELAGNEIRITAPTAQTFETILQDD
jgi:hypothetical protein